MSVMAFDALLFHLRVSIGGDERHITASAYDMSLTTHTLEKSLLSIISEGIITSDKYISAIEVVNISKYLTQRQMGGTDCQHIS
jgi:hypothetical protein